MITMNRFILTLSAFALIVSVTLCASHAHASVDNNPEISISIDVQNLDHDTLKDSCDMSCGGCCVHHVIYYSHDLHNLISINKNKVLLPNTALFVSDVIYGLKRPPKS